MPGHTSSVTGISVAQAAQLAALATSSTDNALVRFDGASGGTQNTSWLTADDAPANGELFGIKWRSELLTVAASATTDTTMQIAAGDVVLGVVARVTVVIPTAATWDLGISGATTRYGTGILVAANTTHKTPAGNSLGSGAYASAISLRVTPNLTPGDNSGRIRITVFYLSFTAPTS